MAAKVSLLDAPAPVVKKVSLLDAPAPASAYADVVPGKPMAPGPWKPPSAKEVAALGGPVSLLDAPAPSRTAGLSLSPALAGSGAQVRQPVVNGVRVNTAGAEPDKLGGLFPQGSASGGVGAAIKTAGTAVNKGITAATTPLSVAHAFQNQIAIEQAKVERRAGPAKGLEVLSPADSLGIIQRAIKNTDWSGVTKKGLSGQEFTPYSVTSILAQQGPKGNVYQKAGVNPAVLDFVLSFGADAAVGEGQNKLMGLLGQGLGALDRTTGLSKKVMAKIPALQDYVQGKKVMTGAQEMMSRNAAGAESYLRDAADTANDVQRTSQKYVNAGAPIRGHNPNTGQVTNVFDTLVADYIDAGNPGSRFESVGNGSRGAELQHVAQQAQAYGVDMKDVQRIGDKYSGTLDTLGQKLVDFGLLKPEAYATLKGQYLPRLYLLTKGNPEDVEGYLKFLEGNGALTPEAMLEARSRLGGKGFGAGLGPKTFTKARELTDIEQRNAPEFARAMIPEATPAALHGISSQARAVGEASGHAEIAANPAMAVPLGQITAEQARSWKPFAGKGPLEGMAVHPGVAKILEWRKIQNPGPIYNTLKLVSPKAADAWQSTNGVMRKLWLSSPRTQINIVNGHYQLVHDAAAINGASFGLPQYAKALGELRSFDQGGAPSQYLQEALGQTSILSEGGSLIPKEARAVTGTFGVETPGELAKQLPGKAWAAYRGVTHDALAGGKYGLYVALRQAGKSVAEAAKVVKAAAIDYSDVHPIIRALERDNLAPFITFPLKAVSQYLNQALRRPDLFYTSTGQRARDFLDRLAGPEAQEKRRSGAAGPADFPIPGRKNESGEQAYVRAPLLAPALHHFLHVGPEPSDIVTEQLTHGLPLWNSVQEMAKNEQDIGQGRTVPISPFGAVPGKPGFSAEKAADYGKYLAKKALPEATDLFRLGRAAQGRPEYDTLASPVPQVPDTVLRALTGVSLSASLGQNKIQKGMTSGERLQASRSPELEKFVTEYAQSLAPRFARDLSFVPNPEYGRAAAGVPKEKLPEAIKNATNSFALALMRSVGPIAQRKQAVKDRLDWVWALGVAAGKAGIEDIQGLTPEERAPFGSVFGRQ